MNQRFAHMMVFGLVLASCGTPPNLDAAAEPLGDWHASRQTTGNATPAVVTVAHSPSPLPEKHSALVPHPETTGAIPAADVERVISTHKAKVRRCYEHALQTQPELAGKLTANFFIEPDGQVKQASILAPKSTVNDARLWSCVVEVVRGMRFPAPVGGSVEVVYPFVLTPTSVQGVETEGSLSSEEITRVVISYSADVRRCYEQALKIRPELRGQLAVFIAIGADGVVTESSIHEEFSTVRDDSLERCMLGVVRGMRFAAPSGGSAAVVYPFVLTPD